MKKSSKKNENSPKSKLDSPNKYKMTHKNNLIEQRKNHDYEKL